jgi:microcystin-dependent protein
MINQRMQRNRNKTYTISALLLLSGIASAFTLIYPLSRSSFAHTFSGDESAAFLALIRQIRAELTLVQENLPSNIPLSQQHAQDAVEHIDVNTTKELAERNKRVTDDLTSELNELQNSLKATPIPSVANITDQVNNLNDTLEEAISVRIEPDQLNNSTVKALALNDMLGEILEHYGEAHGIEQIAREGEEEQSYNETSSTPTSTTANETNSNTTIVNVTDYQSAKALAGVAIEMFNEIKTLAPSNVSDVVSKLDSGLTELKQAINNQSSYDTVDKIVDSKIIPNLQGAFNFRLESSS